jgi:TolB protein
MGVNREETRMKTGVGNVRISGVVLTVLAAVVAAGILAVITVRSAEAAFPGTNGEVVFSSNRATGAQDIFAISPAGGTADRLTTFSTGHNIDPAVSPDGSRIAFSRDGQIWVMKAGGMNANGTGATRITSTSTAKTDPTWSPDGTRIAYVANSFDVDQQTDLEIWVINADGSGRTQLTDNTVGIDDQPAWSPDGTQIAFVSARTGDNNRNIYVMDANGDNQTDITQDSPYENTTYQGHDDDPSWSPDGLTIAYTHTFAPNASGVPNIWTMTATGGGKDNLQNDQNTSGSQPAWSPDGNRIAFVGAEDTNRDIYRIDANGANQAPFETEGNPAHDISPDWQPVVPSLRLNDVRVKEKNTSARFVVRLSAASQQTVTVNYTTANGTAKAPADYATRRGTLTFLPGQTARAIAVPIRSDRRNERNEVFFVRLFGAASTPIADAIGRGTIKDND